MIKRKQEFAKYTSAVSGSYLHHCSISKTAHLELLRSNFVCLQQGIWADCKLSNNDHTLQDKV